MSILSVSTRIELDALGAFFAESDSEDAFLTTVVGGGTITGAITSFVSTTAGVGADTGVATLGFFFFLGFAKGESSSSQSSSTQLKISRTVLSDASLTNTKSHEILHSSGSSSLKSGTSCMFTLVVN